MYSKMFSSIFGLYPLDASGTPPIPYPQVLTITMSPDIVKYLHCSYFAPQLRTTEVYFLLAYTAHSPLCTPSPYPATTGVCLFVGMSSFTRNSTVKTFWKARVCSDPNPGQVTCLLVCLNSLLWQAACLLIILVTVLRAEGKEKRI